MRGRRFNKQATTPYFHLKVRVAQAMISQFEGIMKNDGPGGWCINRTVYDKSRDLCFEVSIWKKIKGLGKGQPNYCMIRFASPPNMFQALCKQEVMVFAKQLNVKI